MSGVDLDRLTEALYGAWRVALQAAGDDDLGGQWRQPDPVREPGYITDGHGEVVTYDEGSPSEEQAAHIVFWDPKRVLALIERDRETLGFHAPNQDSRCSVCFDIVGIRQSWPCFDALAVARFWLGDGSGG